MHPGRTRRGPAPDAAAAPASRDEPAVMASLPPAAELSRILLVLPAQRGGVRGASGGAAQRRRRGLAEEGRTNAPALPIRLQDVLDNNLSGH